MGFFCAGAVLPRSLQRQIIVTGILKRRLRKKKKREMDRVARRSRFAEGKDAIEGETHVRCRGGEEEEEDKEDKDKEGKETRRLTTRRSFSRTFQRTERTPRWLSSTCRVTFEQIRKARTTLFSRRSGAFWKRDSDVASSGKVQRKVYDRDSRSLGTERKSGEIYSTELT